MEHKYIIKIYEAHSVKHVAHVCPVDDRPLAEVFEQYGVDISYCTVNGARLLLEWGHYIPVKGDLVVAFPKVGVKQFSNAFVDNLNKRDSAGVFVQTVEVVENPIGPVVHYFVKHHESIQFNGQTYLPLFMEWSGFEVDNTMNLPQMAVSVPAMKDQVMTWAEEVDIRENDITFRLLHLGLLSDPIAQDQFILQIQTMTGDSNVVVVNCGLNLGFEDDLPRGIITKKEFPGIPDNAGRILI